MAEKVLLIRLSSLGDVVLATSAVEALKSARPEATVDVLTKPQFAEVFAGNPHVREVKTWGAKESPLEVAARLRAEKYTFIADLHANLRTRLLRPLLPGRWSVYGKGAVARRASLFLRARSLISDAPHVTTRYAASLSRLGVKKPAIPKIYTDERQLGWVKDILTGAGWDSVAPLVALAPGAAWATKAWPEEKWRELADLLRARGALPLLIGGEGDRALCEAVKGTGAGINLAGETTVRETAAALTLAKVLVTNDSAPLHIADAVGTPVVALFGPTVADFGFFPTGARDVVVERDEPCRPCSLHGGPRCPLGHFHCLGLVTAEQVVKAALPLLEAAR